MSHSDCNAEANADEQTPSRLVERSLYSFEKTLSPRCGKESWAAADHTVERQASSLAPHKAQPLDELPICVLPVVDLDRGELLHVEEHFRCGLSCGWSWSWSLYYTMSSCGMHEL